LLFLKEKKRHFITSSRSYKQTDFIMQTINHFAYTDILDGYTEGITRRDPSPVLQMEGRFYVWYSRSTETHSGYTATIWYADSVDGHNWTERGQALGRGTVGSWDEHAVFTPSLFVFEGMYYLSYTAVAEPFYNGAHGHPEISTTAIGLAKAETPHGPWHRVSPNPILEVDPDPKQFDSQRIDDSCFIIRNGRIHLYYKGRQIGFGPEDTKMGLAISSHPEGPYQRASCQPLVDGGHEVCVWPTNGGVASLHNKVGPEGNSLQFSKDGIHFSRIQEIVPPKAPGPLRMDQWKDNENMTLSWGICMKSGPWPYLQRFEAL
jgi:hypothetical protein